MNEIRMTLDLAHAILSVDMVREVTGHEFDDAEEAQAWESIAEMANAVVNDAREDYLASLRGSMV